MNPDRAGVGGSDRWQWLLRVGFALALIGHLALAVAPSWREVKRQPRAGDFASYYYAVRAAEEGHRQPPFLTSRFAPVASRPRASTTEGGTYRATTRSQPSGVSSPAGAASPTPALLTSR